MGHGPGYMIVGHSGRAGARPGPGTMAEDVLTAFLDRILIKAYVMHQQALISSDVVSQGLEVIW